MTDSIVRVDRNKSGWVVTRLVRDKVFDEMLLAFLAFLSRAPVTSNRQVHAYTAWTKKTHTHKSNRETNQK